MNEKVDTANELQVVRKVTWAGLAANVCLSILKVAAGVLGGSQAVVADGVHSLSDTATDVAVIVGVKYWTAPPDGDHHFGHRRIETVITMFIGLLLAAVAIGIGWNAFSTIGEKHKAPPEAVALIAALISIVGKEALYRWNLAVGNSIGSRAMIANAWHHRSDGLSSIPAAIAVAVAMIFPGLYFIDHAGAIIVCFFILYAAWSIAWPAVREVSDAGVSEIEVSKIRKIALLTDGVKDVHRVRTRWIGDSLQVDMHIEVDPEKTVAEGHEISEAVKERLLKDGPGIIDVEVHLEPYEKGRE